MVKTKACEFPVYRRLDLEIVQGQGAVVQTADGTSFLDFYGGHATSILGYGHARLLERLQQQAKRLFFQTNAVELRSRQSAAEALASMSPAELDQVFFVNSGAEANENALRLAFRKTGRKRIVALSGSFHGRTAAAAACTDKNESWFGFPRAPFDVDFVTPNTPGAFDAVVDDDVAAVILEPIQGMAGAKALNDEFLVEARNICSARGALLIADEVQCGMGRSGRFFGFESSGVIPDIVTLAKGLAGGFPAGAVIARAEHVAALRPGDMGTTFGGGPLATSLIDEVIQVIKDDELLSHVEAMGRLLKRHCKVGPIIEIHGRGLLLGLETRSPAAPIRQALQERGILTGSASHPNIIRLMPPLIIEEEQVMQLATALGEFSS